MAVSNPDKVFFPDVGLTKGDLVGYYLDVAGCALPHLRGRPFHMVRYPNGVDADFFHQKRVPAHPDFVGEQFVQFPSGHSTVFAIVSNRAALEWVINLGCIELHTWHSRVPEIEKPDYLLIDLDPSRDGQWPYVREIALVVREVMEELGLAVGVLVPRVSDTVATLLALAVYAAVVIASGAVPSEIRDAVRHLRVSAQ